MEDRILYEKTHALIFVYEAWIRDIDPYGERLSRTLPVRGEKLVVIGIDRGGNILARDIEIVRASAQLKPSLARLDSERSKLKLSACPFLIPVNRAFDKLSTTDGTDRIPI